MQGLEKSKKDRDCKLIYANLLSASAKKKVFRSYSQNPEEDIRRSRSLDGEIVLGPISSQIDKNKSKSAWSKVKGIVKTHKSPSKGTAKSSKTSGVSRDVSPCDSSELQEVWVNSVPLFI